MVKAGLDTSLPWNAGRKWWQVSKRRPFTNRLGSSSLDIIVTGTNT